MIDLDGRNSWLAKSSDVKRLIGKLYAQCFLCGAPVLVQDARDGCPADDPGGAYDYRWLCLGEGCSHNAPVYTGDDEWPDWVIQ